MSKAVIPSTKLRTGRDRCLSIVYSTEVDVNDWAGFPKAEELKQSIRALEHAERTPGTLTDNDLRRLRVKVENLRDDLRVHWEGVNYLVGKREGFVAGIKHAASVFHRNPADLLSLILALSDEAHADQLLYDVTRHLPEPSLNADDYFRPDGVENTDTTEDDRSGNGEA